MQRSLFLYIKRLAHFLKEDPAYKAIKAYYDTHGLKINMNQLFAKDPCRFKKYSIVLNTPNEGQILFDYSKNLLTEEVWQLLLNLAKARKVEEVRADMFSALPINFTERRPALHIALRNRSNEAVCINGKDIMPDINTELQRMKEFTEKIHTGEWKGCTGKAITDVINIGIGGSDLGPLMVTKALTPYNKMLRVHFVANVDGTHIAQVLNYVNYETTLFIVASKTFTTQETLVNAMSAKTWFLKHANDVSSISKHFVAVSIDKQRVVDFGINIENVFLIWDWVGGRYSIWSTVGLSVCLSIGYENFVQFLEGAHFMDNHFKTAPLEQNIPVILALLGVWYINFYGAETHAILPYNKCMHRFAAYFQQTDMESNGKNVTKTGSKLVDYQTGPIIWGKMGTNSQHTFFQLLHQGTRLIPCDFICAAISHYPIAQNKHQKILLAHFIAQTQALMSGRDIQETREKLTLAGMKDEDLQELLPHKVIPGNRPTNSIVVKIISPYIIGALIAMYEHKVFTQGIIWDINSFDQWGVQLGKELANKIEQELDTPDNIENHDSSTNGLINFIKKIMYNKK